MSDLNQSISKIYILSYGLYLSNLYKIIKKPFLRGLILSVYVNSFSNLKIPTEPFYIYYWILKNFSLITPDVYLVSIKENVQSKLLSQNNGCLFNTSIMRGIINAIKIGKSTSTILTLIYMILLDIFKIPSRLATNLHKMVDLNIIQSKDKEWEHKVNNMLVTSELLDVKTSFVCPIIWSELYWDYIDKWTGAEFYDIMFNISLVRARSTVTGIKDEELHCVYLKTYADNLLAKLDPRFWILNHELITIKVNDEQLSNSIIEDIHNESIDSSLSLDDIYDTNKESRYKFCRSDIRNNYFNKLNLTCQSTMDLLEKNSGFYYVLHPFYIKNGKNIFNTYSAGILAYTIYSGYSCVDARYITSSNILKKNLSLNKAMVQVMNNNFNKYIVLNNSTSDKFNAFLSYLNHLIEYDQIKLELLELGGSRIPTSKEGFRNHPVYVLPALLKPNELLDLEKAKSCGIFKGNKIYRRDQVTQLYSENDWFNRGRIVIKGQHKKTVEIKTRDNIIKEIKLYSINETRPIDQLDLEQRLSKQQKFIDIRKLKIPDGYKHYPIDKYPYIFTVIKKLNLPHFVALNGYNYINRRLKPIQNGILAAKIYDDEILNIHNEVYKNRLAKAEELVREKSIKYWKILFKMLIALWHDTKQ